MSIATHLIDAYEGTLLAPGDRGWDAARQAFNTDIDQQPAAIAMPADAIDVANALRFATRNGLRVAPQRTGHNAGPLGDLDDVLLLKTDAFEGVEIDAGARRVRVGAATRWEQVTPRLSELGLAALHGSSPDVGIVGYSLGGGIGWLARKHGMQTNAVTAIELVTADGRLVRADHEHEPELFWALRGGGGNFGVVTALEFEIFPIRALYAGALFFALEQTADVFHAWTELLPSLPEELTSWASVLHFPPLPELPEAIRGRSFAIVMAAFLGSEAEGRELLRPLRRLRPLMDTFAMQAPAELGDLAMDPRAPLPFRSAHALVDALPSAAIEDVARISGPGSSLALVQLRHMGGALTRHEPDAGARATLPGEICVFGLGVVPEAGAEPAVLSDLAALSAAVAPRRVGDYPNFVETPADTSGFFAPGTWERLRRVKALYDPQDLFKANHHIPA
ncbi:MAG TPA: FAD-binding oxidoreductase [Solirubrobacter sp.]